jgi:hypothetical protein
MRARLCATKRTRRQPVFGQRILKDVFRLVLTSIEAIDQICPSFWAIKGPGGQMKYQETT